MAKKSSVYGVVNNMQLILIVGQNYKLQLNYFHYKTITDKNKQWVPVCNSSVTNDEAYNTYVLGYEKIEDQWGYWKNKDAKFLTTQYGPSLFINKDKHEVYWVYRRNIDFKATQRRLKDLRIIMLKDYKMTEVSFEEVYNAHLGRHLFVLATVEFL